MTDLSSEERAPIMTDQQQMLPITDSQKLYAMALALKAIDDAYEELAAFKAQVKARVETLVKETRALRFEILSGQERLPLEVSMKEEQCVTPVDSTAAPMTDSVAVGAIGAQIPHAGTLKTTIPTLTTSTKTTESQALETSTEERARERKKRRMRSQSAILPDAPTPKLGVQP